MSSQHFPGLNPEQKPKRGKSFLIRAPRRKFPWVRSEQQVSQQSVQFGKTGWLSLKTWTGRIIQDFSIVSCSFYQRPLEGCHAMITWHSNCWPGSVFPLWMTFIRAAVHQHYLLSQLVTFANACDHFSNWFILRCAVLCCPSRVTAASPQPTPRLLSKEARSPGRSREGRTWRRRPRRCTAPEVRPEFSDPEWPWVTLMRTAGGTFHDSPPLINSRFILLLFAIATSVGVREFIECSASFCCWSFLMNSQQVHMALRTLYCSLFFFILGLRKYWRRLKRKF